MSFRSICQTTKESASGRKRLRSIRRRAGGPPRRCQGPRPGKQACAESLARPQARAGRGSAGRGAGRNALRSKSAQARGTRAPGYRKPKLRSQARDAGAAGDDRESQPFQSTTTAGARNAGAAGEGSKNRTRFFCRCDFCACWRYRRFMPAR